MSFFTRPNAGGFSTASQGTRVCLFLSMPLNTGLHRIPIIGMESNSTLAAYADNAQPYTSRLSGSRRCIYDRAWVKKDIHVLLMKSITLGAWLKKDIPMLNV